MTQGCTLTFVITRTAALAASVVMPILLITRTAELTEIPIIGGALLLVYAAVVAASLLVPQPKKLQLYGCIGFCVALGTGLVHYKKVELTTTFQSSHRI